MRLPIESGIQIDVVLFSDQFSEIILECIILNFLNHESILILHKSKILTAVSEYGSF